MTRGGYVEEDLQAITADEEAYAYADREYADREYADREYTDREYADREYADRAPADESVLEHVVRSVRQNPVPAALMGASVAWMLFGEQRVGRRVLNGVADTRPVRHTTDAISRASRAAARAASEAGDVIGEVAQDTVDRAGEMTSSVSDAVRSATGRAERSGERVDRAIGRDRATARDVERDAERGLGAAAGGVSRAARDASVRVREHGQRLARTATELPREGARLATKNLLVTATLGLAAGAGLAAVLPRTRLEDDLIGDQRDELIRGAKERTVSLVSDGVDAARESTAKSVEAAAQRAAKEAADQVLGRADAVSDVVKSALDTIGSNRNDGASGRSG